MTRGRRDDSHLVYSTDGGRVTSPAAKAGAQRKPRASAPRVPDDGVVRIARAKRAGGGKAAMAITGLAGSEAELDGLLKRCKSALGVGGSREGRVLYIQGEARERLRDELAKLGIVAKLAGG